MTIALTLPGRPGRGLTLGSDPATAAPSTYVDLVGEVLPGVSPEAARADALLLCQEILNRDCDRGVDSAAELVRSHYADRVELDDDQVVAILRAVLSDA